jgi:hypothetical protein
VFKAAVLALLLGSGISAWAEDWGRALASVAYEGNKNTLENSGDFAWAFSLAVEKSDLETYGIRFAASQDFVQFVTVETTFFSRFYVWGSGKYGLAPYWELDLGMSTIMKDNEPTLRCLQGITVGLRIPLGERGFVEPYLRAGYPFWWGGGIAFGGFNRGKPQN